MSPVWSTFKVKKIISLITAIFIFSNYSSLIAADTLTLSAVVGNSNHAPVITLVTPDLDPNYLAQSVEWNLVKQNYTIKYRDDEKDEVTYTITTETDWWAVNPTSWTISSYDINNEANIFFEYISPTSSVWLKKITVTISDWPNVTIKTINVYIY